MLPARRFGKAYSMPIAKVEQLMVLADQAFTCNEHACNGDVIIVAVPVARRDPSRGHGYTEVRDKNTAAKLWQARVDATTKSIEELVKPYGFTAVVYTGLRPTLKRGEDFIEIPI